MVPIFRKIHAGLVLGSMLISGCATIPVTGTFGGHFRGEANVATTVQGSLEVKVPPVPDTPPLQCVIVRKSPHGPQSPRVAIVDVDGLILNQNATGLLSVGENPVAAFREKLQTAAEDAQVRAVVLRINSPGGGVTASDIMAEELRRFRQSSGKPVVSCMMDLATGGAYYLAIGSNRVVAHPTTVTGGVGVIFNVYNLSDAMGQLAITADPIKSGKLVDMGTVTTKLEDPAHALLQDMADNFHDRFRARVIHYRPSMSPADRQAIDDGRVLPANKALALKMIDRIGYLDDAIADAESLASTSASEVVQYQRPGTPNRSIYSVAPNAPIQSELIPFSYPGLDRSKMPTFLYLWQPDPTVLRQSGR